MADERITYERALRKAEIDKATALLRIADALEKIVAHLKAGPALSPTPPEEPE